MIKTCLQRLMWIIALLACSSNAWADQVTAMFDFSSPQTLASMGLATPTSSTRTNITSTITKQGVTLTPSASPIPQVTYYKEAYNLYMFSNTSITLTVPTGAIISNVTFTGLYETVNMKASTGNIIGLTWTGSTNSLKLTATGSNTIYTVAVTYTTAGAPIKTVTGLGEFRQVPDGTTARLYLPDDYNCRVTYASEDGAEVYLRDKTGAIMLDNVDASRTFKHGQHIAGWITGKSYYQNGMYKLVADGAFTNTSQLVIADAVTEANVNATTITPPAYAKHAANLVRLMNLTVKNGKAVYGSFEFSINNLYGMGKDELYQTPYEGATIDLVCLAVPTANGNTLIPVYVNEVPPVYYVVNEKAPFVAPSANITNTSVRLTRDLTAGEWSTIVLPFDLDRFNGSLMQPAKLTNGTLTMTQASRLIEHNKPYLFKPVANGDNTTYYQNVTLYAGGATTVNGMTGMYNPTFVNSMVTALAYMGDTPVLVKVDASSVPTTYAYFTDVASLNVNGTIISLLGDVNGDAKVDIADINATIDIILDGDSNIYGGRTDVNGDGKTDIADINAIINLILEMDINTDVVIKSPMNNTNTK